MALVNYTFTSLLNADSGGQNTVASEAVEVRFQFDATLATIYSDSAGASPIAQPGAATDANGVLSFWALPGYYTITAASRTENVVIDDGSRLNPLVLSDAQANIKNLKLNEVFEVVERTSGNGGGAKWKVIAKTTENGFDIVAGDATRSLQLIVGNSVKALQWGAVLDKVTDDTGAIQAAIDYAVSNNLDLDMSGGLALITSELFVDRAVDGAAFDLYFTIKNGGFYANTAINIFSNRFAWDGTNPNAQLVKWSNVAFETSDRDLSTYVLDDNRFLRSTFENCSFAKIRLVATTTYLQSIYLLNCQARRWAGIFCSALRSYDIQIIGGMYEGAGTGLVGFLLWNSTGLKVWSQLEGISTTALEIPGANGADISCYFELNGRDIDMAPGGIHTKGVLIHGCNMINPTTTYTVRWGQCSGCVSKGNYHDGYMHELAANSQVDINDYAAISLSNQDAARNNGYRESTNTALTLRGAASASYTVTAESSKYTANGGNITLLYTCTLTSTATNPADTLFLTAGLPFPVASNVDGAICGSVEIVGSTVNNGISPLYISNASLGRVLSSINVIPSNIATDSWTIRMLINYIS